MGTVRHPPQHWRRGCHSSLQPPLQGHFHHPKLPLRLSYRGLGLPIRLMIAAGRLAASLDQVDGVLHFHATQNALDSFDESIKALCLGVNACYEHAEQLAA